MRPSVAHRQHEARQHQQQQHQHTTPSGSGPIAHQRHQRGGHRSRTTLADLRRWHDEEADGVLLRLRLREFGVLPADGAARLICQHGHPLKLQRPSGGRGLVLRCRIKYGTSARRQSRCCDDGGTWDGSVGHLAGTLFAHARANVWQVCAYVVLWLEGAERQRIVGEVEIK